MGVQTARGEGRRTLSSFLFATLHERVKREPSGAQQGESRVTALRGASSGSRLGKVLQLRYNRLSSATTHWYT